MSAVINDSIRTKLDEFRSFVKWEAMSYYDESEQAYVDDAFLREAAITEDQLSALFSDSPSDITRTTAEAKVEREILLRTKNLLVSKPEMNQAFGEKTEWKVLTQILTVIRLKELSGVKITKRGVRGKGLRYDASELARTFFGKKILNGLGFTRRRILQADELDKVKADCARLKLTLPEIVEPTTTEKFFS